MPNQNIPASFFRRMAVIVYDLFLLIAVLFLATLILVPFHSAGAFEPGSSLYSAYLVLVCFVFYAWFWIHGGQTLGLQTWKLQLVSDNQQAISWSQALVRFSVSILSWGCFGLGFLWIYFNDERLSWHDIASKSRLEWAAKKNLS